MELRHAKATVSLLLATICAAIALPCSAALILVEPDNFTEGTDIRSLYPGITLSVNGFSSPVRSRSGVMDGGPTAGTNIATTGSLVFGHDILGPTTPATDFLKIWTGISPGPILRADFHNQTSFVSIDMIANDDDSFELLAFNEQGDLLDSFLTGEIRNTSVTASITRPTADISYILAGGIAPEGAGLLDNLRFETNAISAPSSLACLIIGLLLYASMGLRTSSPISCRMSNHMLLMTPISLQKCDAGIN